MGVHISKSNHEEPGRGSVYLTSDTLKLSKKKVENIWMVYTDGSCNKMGSSFGCHIITLDGKRVERSIQIKFIASSNKAKYEAVIYTLNLVINMGAFRVQLFNDLKLIASKFGRHHKVKNDRMSV